MSSLLNSSKTFGNFPLGIKWLIEESCNLNCSHCSYMESALKCQRSLSTIETFKIIDKIAKSTNIIELQLLGGEPLLRSGYKEIIDRIIESNISVSIITNGTLVDHEFLHYEPIPKL